MNIIEDRFKKFFIKLLKIFIRSEKIEDFPKDEIKRILIIRQHNQLGDMLCAVPLFRALRYSFPKAKIDLISRPINTDAVTNNPFLNEIIEYNSVQLARSPFAFFAFIKKIRIGMYDLALVPSTVSMSLTSGWLAYLSRAKYRIGPGSIDGIQNRTKFFYNLPLDFDWRNKPHKHQTERNLEIVQKFNISTNDFDLVIGLSKEERKYGFDFFNKYCNKNKISFGIHPGAGKVSNKWNINNFVELIDRLKEKFHPSIFISCGPVDLASVEYLKSIFKDEIILIKEQSVRRAAAIIDNLTLFISNDTGMMHVAAATKVPVLSLFGSTDPNQWAPRRKIDRFIFGSAGEINNITVDEVHFNIEEMLGIIKFNTYISQQSHPFHP